MEERISPYLKGPKPAWECPRCHVVIENESFHWIMEDILAHIRAEKPRMKDDGRQISLEGKRAMVPLKQGNTLISRSGSQLSLNGKILGGDKVNMPWKKRESGGTWGGRDLKNGDQITGKLNTIVDNANARPDKPLHDYLLETSDGQVRVWGAAFLEGKFSQQDIGKEIRITFHGLGKAKKGQKPAKQFEVEVKE